MMLKGEPLKNKHTQTYPKMQIPPSGFCFAKARKTQPLEGSRNGSADHFLKAVTFSIRLSTSSSAVHQEQTKRMATRFSPMSAHSSKTKSF